MLLKFLVFPPAAWRAQERCSRRFRRPRCCHLSRLVAFIEGKVDSWCALGVRRRRSCWDRDLRLHKGFKSAPHRVHYGEKKICLNQNFTPRTRKLGACLYVIREPAVAYSQLVNRVMVQRKLIGRKGHWWRRNHRVTRFSVLTFGPWPQIFPCPY